MKPFTLNPSPATLNITPARVLEFLRGISSTSEIFHAMKAAGYSTREHDLGFELLAKFAAVRTPPPPRVRVSLPHETALAELSTWRKTVLRRVRAALQRLHPAQAAFLFEGIDDTPGTGDVTVATIFLARVAELEKGAARKDTRKADHATLATMAERGLTSAALKQARGWIELAKRPPADDDVTVVEDPRTEILRELRAWYVDWAETARTVIRRRDLLIRVGLSSRRRSSKEGGDPTPTPAPVAPAPSPVASPTDPVTG